MESTTCRNCGDSTIKKFCPSCGEQKYKRILMKDVLGDFLSNLLALEGPILRTIKDLTLRPGIMINDYLQGKRKVYYKPFQYYILATTVYFLFFYAWGDEILVMFSDIGADANTTGTAAQISTFQQEMNEFQSKNMRLFTFFQIPMYSWLIWLFFRRKSGHSFTETFVASLYILAQMLLFGIISTSFEFFHTGVSLVLNAIFMFIYLPWVLIQLYCEGVLKTILKSFTIIALVFILYGLLMAVISVVWIILLR